MTLQSIGCAALMALATGVNAVPGQALAAQPPAQQQQQRQAQSAGQEQQAALPPATPVSSQSASAVTTANDPATISNRQQGTGMVEQTLNSVLITLGMLAATGAGLIYMRKRLQQKVTLAGVVGPSLRLKERLRLNPRLTVYVLHYRDREILLAQSGDSLITLGNPAAAAVDAAPGPAGFEKPT